MPGDTFLSQLALHRDASGVRLFVGSRGTNTIGVLALDPSGNAELVAEVPTAVWPSHLVIIGDELIIAGTGDDMVAAHHIDPELPGCLSPVTWRARVAAPYCTLVRS